MPYRFLTEARSAIDIGGTPGQGPKKHGRSIRGRQKHSPKSDAVVQVKQNGHHEAKQPERKQTKIIINES